MEVNSQCFLKPSTEKLIDELNEFVTMKKRPTESPTNIYKFRVDSNGILRREIDGKITKLDDGNRQAFQGNRCQQSKVDKKQMNDSIKLPKKKPINKVNKSVTAKKRPTESPTNIYKFRVDSNGILRREIEGNITMLDNGNRQAFQGNRCQESEFNKMFTNDSIKLPTEKPINQINESVTVKKQPIESPTNIYKFRVDSNGILRREIEGNITNVDDGNRQAFQGNVCQESEFNKMFTNDSIKLPTEKPINQINESVTVKKWPSGSPTNIYNFLMDSNDVSRREIEGNITNLDDGNRQAFQGNVCQESEFDKMFTNDSIKLSTKKPINKVNESVTVKEWPSGSPTNIYNFLMDSNDVSRREIEGNITNLDDGNRQAFQGNVCQESEFDKMFANDSIKLPTEKPINQINESVTVKKWPFGSPTNIYNFLMDSNDVARREIEGNITNLDDGNRQAFQGNVCQESEFDKMFTNDSIKLPTEKPINQINESVTVKEWPSGSPTNIYNFLMDSNDVSRSHTREIEGNITNLDDGNIQAFQENIYRQSKVDNKSMDDLQEILNAVVDIVSHGVNTNLPSATMILLRTLTTLIRQKMDNLIDTCEESVTCKKITEKIPPANVGEKRVCDVDECTVKKSRKKKQKTKHECHKLNELSTTTSISSLMERNTTNISTEDNLKTTKTSEPTATTRNENHNIQIKKFEFSRLVVNELRPHYDRNYFATKELFQFMAKSIVHKLLDTTVYPGEYTIQMKIRQMMSNVKIESEVQILKLLKSFF